MTWTGERKKTLPADWPTRRLAVLARDKRRCQIQGPRCIDRAVEVDHIGDRLDHSQENLRAACTPCHRSRSSRQGALAVNEQNKKLRSARRRPENRHPGGVRKKNEDGRNWTGPQAE